MNVDVEKILESLAYAFCGYSQIPVKVYAQALLGWINNGGISIAEADAVAEKISAFLAERWEFSIEEENDILSEIKNSLSEEIVELTLSQRVSYGKFSRVDKKTLRR